MFNDRVLNDVYMTSCGALTAQMIAMRCAR